MTSKGWKDKDTFTFWVPAQAISVSKSTKDAKGKTKRWLQGIASTDARDLQGEVVSQKGIDFTYFLKHGYFNNDHKPGFENKVGEPTECKVTSKGLWVKGFLYDNHKISDQIWDLMNSQEATDGSKRRIGFSIEGKVKRRNGSTIDECWIQDIAITPAPVNTTTWAEIAKSLSAEWSEKALDSSSVHTPEVLLDKDKTEETTKSLSLLETTEYIQKSEGLERADAENLAKVIFYYNRSKTHE